MKEILVLIDLVLYNPVQNKDEEYIENQKQNIDDAIDLEGMPFLFCSSLSIFTSL